MKKQIQDYTIEVQLNHRIEKRIGGRVEHKVTVSSENQNPIFYFIDDLNELKDIETNLLKEVSGNSPQEKKLIEMGYE